MRFCSLSRRLDAIAGLRVRSTLAWISEGLRRAGVELVLCARRTLSQRGGIPDPRVVGQTRAHWQARAAPIGKSATQQVGKLAPRAGTGPSSISQRRE